MSKDVKEQSHFEKLRAINVNEHTEKKNNLTYLSWAWAVDQLLLQDPMANWEYAEPKYYGETMMVFCTVTAFNKAMTAQLPVMDHRNQPIPKPNAFQVNTAMQRCLAKAIALHGLGLYIYAGEDLPDGEEPAQTKAQKNQQMHRDIEDDAKAMGFDADKHFAALKAELNTVKDLDTLKLWWERYKTELRHRGLKPDQREEIKNNVNTLKTKMESK